MVAEESTTLDGTGQGLVSFFAYVTGKGLMNKNTAGALRAACTQVLAVESGDLASIKLQDLDVDNILLRFRNLRHQDFTPDSLTAYQIRFRKALNMYKEYLENPSTWKPPKREHISASNGGPPKPSGSAGSIPKPNSGLTTYPFPLRDGVMVQLHLPVDLRKAEVKRLSAFLESLAMDEMRALPPASDPEPTES